jgi:hypothetical protein
MRHDKESMAMAFSCPAFLGNVRIRRAAMNAPPMKFGERGPSVAILQAALIDLGYKMPKSTRKTGLPDGIFGKETKNTIYRFQVDKYLKGKDGIAGKETFAKLDQLLKAVPLATLMPPPPPPLPTTRDYQIGTIDPAIIPDCGAGAWHSKRQTMEAKVQKFLILNKLPQTSLIIGDDAAKHMLYYLMNSGKSREIDPEGMIREVQSAKKRFENEINQAKRYVEMLPEGMHMITSKRPEAAYNLKSENYNWFFAVGGYSTWGKGKAIIRKGSSGREYKLEFEYKFYDRYNWDAGKSVQIFGMTVTDYFMGEFHRQGLAREFDMTGSVKRVFNWRHGATIPSHQYFPQDGR